MPRGQALDALLASPDLWQTPRGGFLLSSTGSRLYWLSTSQDRAETHSKVTAFLKAGV